MSLSREVFANLAEHTLTRQDATPAEVQTLAEEAKRHRFAFVCVNSSYVAMAYEHLKHSGVKVCATVGFPFGTTDTDSKAYEASTAVQNGAEEVNMAIQMGMLKEQEVEYVFNDIYRVVRAAGDVPVKVILEQGLLTEEEKQMACGLAKRADAAFVGFHIGMGREGGAIADMALVRETVGPDFGIVVTGAIRTLAVAEALVQKGAVRLGTACGASIMEEMLKTQ